MSRNDDRRAGGDRRRGDNRRDDRRRGPDPDKPENNVRVSGRGSKFNYADSVRNLLAKGEEFVEISSMGPAVANVVDIVEMMKGNKLVEVKSIVISEELNPARRRSERLCITVVKSKDFDNAAAELDKKREEQRAERRNETENKE